MNTTQIHIDKLMLTNLSTKTNYNSPIKTNNQAITT